MGFQVEAEKEPVGPGWPLLVDPRGFQPRAKRARCDLVILGALRKSGSSPSYPHDLPVLQDNWKKLSPREASLSQTQAPLFSLGPS